MDLIDLAQDRWQDFMNMVMNFRYHKMQGVLGLAEELLTSQQEFCCVEGVRKGEKVTVRYLVGITLQIRKNCKL